MLSLSPRRIVVGISGGIAAYKAIVLVRQLVGSGSEVRVVFSDQAHRFVTEKTLEALSRNPVTTSVYSGEYHVDLADWAEALVVAPATANTLARLSLGLASDALSNLALACRAPKLLAPAMHTNMWRTPTTQEHVVRLKNFGYRIVGPAYGALSGNDQGLGRMVEPEDIIRALNELLAGSAPDQTDSAPFDGFADALINHYPQTLEADQTHPKRDLAGLRLLVTAGGTREALDPARFLGNYSSGRQGVAIAEAAAIRGAEVVLVGANLQITPPANVRLVRVTNTTQLQHALTELAPTANAIIMAAAVSDFRPREISEVKIKKNDEAPEEGGARTLSLNLVQNPDLLLQLTSRRQPGQIIIGFAAETIADPEERLEVARLKLKRKGCDYLVVNQIGWQKGFDQKDNEVMVLDLSGKICLAHSGSKVEIAHRILDLIDPEKSSQA